MRTSMIAGMALALFAAGPAAAASPWGEGYLPDAPLTDQDGRTRRFYSDVLKGRIAVIAFIYTSCRDICPVVTARLAQVQDRLNQERRDKGGAERAADPVFVAISIDPVTDTPARLKDYAEAFGVGPGWSFLTGRPEDIELVRYKLGERSRKLVDHSKTILLYNDATGEWARDSAFGDLTVLASTIRAMNPAFSAGTPAATGGAPAIGEASIAPDLPGQSLFLKTCAACHTVGGGTRVGPDLAGVGSRRSRDWLVSYVTDPQRMRAQGDATALDLARAFPSVRMPNLSLSDTDAADVLAYVEAMTYGAREAAKDKEASAEPADAHAHHHHHHH
ncbi:SCO family protein [Methylobacterium segetis]|nr:SCO family protein [Methylobacterium segetis]